MTKNECFLVEYAERQQLKQQEAIISEPYTDDTEGGVLFECKTKVLV